MLYRFTSKETGDVLMLEAHARRLLEIMGRPPGPSGLIAWTSMALAAQRLQSAVVAEEAQAREGAEFAQRAFETAPSVFDSARSLGGEPGATKKKAREEPEPLEETVSLRQRAAPLLAMMQRCQAAQCDIVWGV